MDVAEIAVAIGDLAEEQRAAVAEDRDELAELVARIRLRNRAVRGGVGLPQQKVDAGRGVKPCGVEAEFAGQVVVEHNELGRRGLLGGPIDGHFRHGIGEVGGQADGRFGGGGRLVRL